MSTVKHTLVLNNDGTPVSIMPFSSMDWQDAIKAIVLRHVTPLHNYDNWVVHSPTTSFVVPSVVISRGPYIFIKRKVSNRFENAFLRDDFTCQYCGATDISPTADHVKPRSKGGSSKLINITTACQVCNNAKGSRIRYPKRMPHHPTYYELVKKIRAKPVVIPHSSWEPYIGWDSKLISVREPTGMPGYQSAN